MRLKDKVAVVTGAARGQGRSHCLSLAKEGINIVAVDICRDLPKSMLKYRLATGSELNKLVSEVRKLGRKSLGVRTDVSKEDEVKEMVSRAVDEFGKIDILVNNAGIQPSLLTVWDTPSETWNKVIDVNLKGVFLCCKFVVPHMIRQKSGKIINISSLLGLKGAPNSGAYCASKFGVIGLTQALATEVGQYNINVNTICPGVLDTAMTRGIVQEWVEKLGMKTPEEVYQHSIEQNQLLKRPITVQDISNVVVWLASEESRNITGATILVDAGWRLK